MKTVLRLLKLEYTKFKDHSLILILLLMFGIVQTISILVVKSVESIPGDAIVRPEALLEFPLVWIVQGYIGNHAAFFFLGLASVFMVVNEISYKTFRQNIIAGLTRKEYFLSKASAIVAISLGAALFYGIITTLFGVIHTRSCQFIDVWDNSWAMTRYFLMTLGYTSFGLLCGLMIRRSGLAILFFLFWGYALELGLKWLLVWKVDFIGKAANFLPLNAMEDLHPFPLYFVHAAAIDLTKDLGIDFPLLLTYGEAAITTIIWIAIFMGIAYRSFTRSNL